MQKFLVGFAAVAATVIAQADTYNVEAGNVDRVIEGDLLPFAVESANRDKIQVYERAA